MKRLSFEELPKQNSERWMSIEDLQDEHWRDMVGQEGLYLVSDYGRIKGFPNRKKPYIHILKVHRNRDGYCSCYFRIDGETKSRSIHRLVALAFLENPNKYPVINHKDENKENNTFENLEWCTQKYNCNYGTFKEKKSKAAVERGWTHPVNKYTLEGVFVCSYKSIVEASKADHANVTGISNCCNYKMLSANNYTYRYANDKEPTFRGKNLKSVKIRLYKNGDIAHTFIGYDDFAKYFGIHRVSAAGIRKGANLKAVRGYDVVVTRSINGIEKILYSSYNKQNKS